MRKALERPVLILFGVSPDGRWPLGWAALSNNGPTPNQAIPLDGGRAIALLTMGWAWSPGGGAMAISGGPISPGWSCRAPRPGREVPPRIRAGGFPSGL